MKHLIIFTDLDGTLLDHATYSFEKAQAALDAIREQNIPLILCSSKTRTEIEHYRKKLGNRHPFIAENGGGIFIPRGYFRAGAGIGNNEIIVGEDYSIIRLGAPYSDLRRTLVQLRSEGFAVQGFGDMTPEEIARETRLDPGEAAMAKERDFDEPFFFAGPNKALPELFAAIRAKGFHYTQGAFFHLLGDSDKGKAVRILTDLYRKERGATETVALGDSPNDIPMLERVTHPVIVQKPDGGYDPRIQVPNIIRAKGIGPEGWNTAVLALLSGRTKG